MVTIIISSACFSRSGWENDSFYCLLKLLPYPYGINIAASSFHRNFIFLPPFFPFSRNDQLLIASTCTL